MRRNLLVASVLVLPLVLPAAVLARTAAAQTPRTAECKVVTATANPALAEKWQEPMNAWLAAGKTVFVATPNGICAW